MEYEDYLNTPLAALRAKSKCLLSRQLNAIKVIPSPSGLPRDWRGLAGIIQTTPGEHSGSGDPTASVLAYWQRNEQTIGQLVKALKEIDRWDVIDDAWELLKSDAEYYLETSHGEGYQLVEGDKSDDLILTIDDVNCIERCGKPQNYHAFLLYDEHDEYDAAFAMNILDTLENKYQLKLCVKDRDLVGGLPFEHQAIMQLIENRCEHLIVIVSDAFLNSEANQFLISFAQALGIERGLRKIIPCASKKIELPTQLKYLFILNYNRSRDQWCFWKQLYQSIRVSNRSLQESEDAKSKAVCYDNNNVKEPPTVTDRKDVCVYEPQKEKIERDSVDISSQNTGLSKKSVSLTSIYKFFTSPKIKLKKKKKQKLAEVLAE